ncbi:UDP-N-acetylglucosamine--N-acetylmuramyl-(pentapeptide) pyrophosphoryl-undecaprenol N-acetylglucosamine transferase [Estrella lausannensis]|uniref:UDP-N-acetylglucosamine--N-acetylmuramyl-(pentapeptide) pyrophosphoryl-undecaprenol N-acetylglucosamine transferase n=1 Tax=Estrella lausannensis TaxID=483423 RepID=A0A0H5DRT1_9BACT|nr:UDP-N-acetylglucosamine--N-acetylmuramyl-(pentapeptide) pyrophosphoryl-undecaprenol N-acetylglucosamine transferase [Estrella lausannensis]CRX39322.1 UDP-N-acetylglucosamine--N-acetylmuramyl-(pentapeptide) pyrophosphoryl-undecaprenol N-acetylglucosamine transferase [Estrella lausannensis]
MVKRVMICTGGTGGHVFPALALARQLKEEMPSLYICFAGGGLSQNRFFDKEAYPFKEVLCGYFPLKNPLKCVASAGKVMAGVIQSGRILDEVKPDLVIGFGSYHTLPLLIATKLRGVPYILHAADSIPGKVIRLMSGSALATGITFPMARKYLRGPVVDVGSPLREDLRQGRPEKEEALARYGLKAGKKTVLIFGGSQGAAFINEMMETASKSLHSLNGAVQFIHLTGLKGDTSGLVKAYREKQFDACVKPFEDKMQYAWTAADLVISRAGAGTIAEQIAFEVPGILIPYPYASENHQEMNAEFMAGEVGGARVMTEAGYSSAGFDLLMKQLITNEDELFTKMQEAIRNFKERAPAEDMCSLVKKLMPTTTGES